MHVVAWRYEISLLMLKNISLVRCAHSLNIFQHSKRNFVSPRGHVISSMYAWPCFFTGGYLQELLTDIDYMLTNVFVKLTLSCNHNKNQA